MNKEAKRWWRKLLNVREFPNKTWLGTTGHKIELTNKAGDWVGHIVTGHGIARTPYHDVAWVDNAGVASEYHNTGLGRYLYGKAAYNAKKSGATTIASDPSHMTSQQAQRMWAHVAKKYPVHYNVDKTRPMFEAALKKTAASYYYSATVPYNVKHSLDSKFTTVPREARHMTLSFLGERPEEQEPLLANLLQNAAHKNKDMVIDAEKLEMLGKNKNVLALSGNPSRRFTKLVRTLEDTAGARSPFAVPKPHITLDYNAAQLPDSKVTRRQIPIHTVNLVKMDKGRSYSIATERLRQRNLLDKAVDIVDANTNRGWLGLAKNKLFPMEKVGFGAELLSGAAALIGTGTAMHVGQNLVSGAFIKSKSGQRALASMARAGWEHGLKGQKLGPTLSRALTYGIGPETTADYRIANRLGYSAKRILSHNPEERKQIFDRLSSLAKRRGQPETRQFLELAKQHLGQGKFNIAPENIRKAVAIGKQIPGIQQVYNATTGNTSKLVDRAMSHARTVPINQPVSKLTNLVHATAATAGTVVSPEIGIQLGVNALRNTVATSQVGKKFMQKSFARGLAGDVSKTKTMMMRTFISPRAGEIAEAGSKVREAMSNIGAA
jgi:2'-5' RNA ligase